MTSNFVKAQENELSVLEAIGLVGWLSTAQIGKWVWGDDNPRSARVSAEKVLTRLQENAQVKRRESALGVIVYILTRLGAVRANSCANGPLFKDGYDLSQLDVSRQAPAVEYLITQHWAGNTVFGQASVRRAVLDGLLDSEGWAGADGLVIDRETGDHQAILVVRNTHPELVKKAKRIRKATGSLKLIGNAWVLKAFDREMLRN